MNLFSLRLRLLGIAALTVVGTLAIAGMSLVFVFERHMERRIEAELVVRLNDVLAAMRSDGQGGVTVDRLAEPRYGRPLSGAYWQVVENGQPILRSRSLWDTAIPIGSLTSPATVAIERKGANGETLYVVEKAVTLGPESGQRSYLVMVALDHGELFVLRDAFTSDVGLVLGAIAFALVFGAWLQSGFGLAPLKALREQLERLRTGQSRRIEGAFPTEVSPLVDDLNQLLSEQEGAIVKARHRAGTLAHGLKTPLAILSGEANRLARNGRQAEAGVIRRQIETMEEHVERELARARANPSPTAYGPRTNAIELAGRLVETMRKLPADRPIHWQLQAEPLLLHMDPNDFGETLGNLLDNARKWAASAVLVTVRADGAVAVVAVEDDGPGLPPELRDIATERGWRGSERVTGSGLGLAIASDVLEAYESALEIGERQGGGSRFAFRIAAEALPEAQPQPSPATSERSLRAAE
jgi:signal transduction histidine kinase